MAEEKKDVTLEIEGKIYKVAGGGIRPAGEPWRVIKAKDLAEEPEKYADEIAEILEIPGQKVLVEVKEAKPEKPAAKAAKAPKTEAQAE